ncbi:MAG: glycosyltransferase family 9 protein [Planctomycetes bacterium]|nr:glycosyltransferase family 9 protein [Planctomycetota bacterium]
MSGALWIARGGALGDVFVLAPALAALRIAEPARELCALGRGSALQVLRDAGLLDRVVDAEGSEAWRAFAPGTAIPERVAEQLVDGERLLSFGFGALRAELAGKLRRGAIDRPPFPRESSLPVWRYLHAACARAFGPLPEPPSAPLERLRRAPTSRRVWIHPGSGSRAKNWPLEHFLALARELEQRDLKCSFALGEAEDERLEAALRAAGRAPQRLRLEALIDELAGAALWIGNDSGLVHLAALIGVPTLALFQASDERAWEPFGPRVRALGSCGAPASIAEARAAMHELLQSG